MFTYNKSSHLLYLNFHGCFERRSVLWSSLDTSHVFSLFRFYAILRLGKELKNNHETLGFDSFKVKSLRHASPNPRGSRLHFYKCPFSFSLIVSVEPETHWAELLCRTQTQTHTHTQVSCSCTRWGFNGFFIISLTWSADRNPMAARTPAHSPLTPDKTAKRTAASVSPWINSPLWRPSPPPHAVTLKCLLWSYYVLTASTLRGRRAGYKSARAEAVRADIRARLREVFDGT